MLISSLLQKKKNEEKNWFCISIRDSFINITSSHKYVHNIVLEVQFQYENNNSFYNSIIIYGLTRYFLLLIEKLFIISACYFVCGD